MTQAADNFIGFILLVMAAAVLGQIAGIIWHAKEKRRKLEMLKEYPHLAREIFQSIEDQDARLAQHNQNFANSLRPDNFRRKKGPSLLSGVFGLFFGVLKLLFLVVFKLAGGALFKARIR
jgi:hypothetical protein